MASVFYQTKSPLRTSPLVTFALMLFLTIGDRNALLPKLSNALLHGIIDSTDGKRCLVLGIAEKVLAHAR